MSGQKILPVGQKVVSAVQKTAQNTEQKAKKVGCINSYEFHLGFVPQKKAGDLHSDEQIERMIDMYV